MYAGVGGCYGLAAGDCEEGGGKGVWGVEWGWVGGGGLGCLGGAVCGFRLRWVLSMVGSGLGSILSDMGIWWKWYHLRSYILQ